MAQRSDGANTKPRTVFMEDETWHDIRRIALERGMNASELVRVYVQAGLRGHKARVNAAEESSDAGARTPDSPG